MSPEREESPSYRKRLLNESKEGRAVNIPKSVADSYENRRNNPPEYVQKGIGSVFLCLCGLLAHIDRVGA